jgi:hypothetical protein
LIPPWSIWDDDWSKTAGVRGKQKVRNQHAPADRLGESSPGQRGRKGCLLLPPPLLQLQITRPFCIQPSTLCPLSLPLPLPPTHTTDTSHSWRAGASLTPRTTPPLPVVAGQRRILIGEEGVASLVFAADSCCGSSAPVPCSCSCSIPPTQPKTLRG